VRYLKPLGWATLIANTVLVLTGGAVRLTGSGLGCPTWPHCENGSFVPKAALGVHGAIEFTNRMLTFGLTVIAILTFITAWRSGRRELRWLAFWLAMFIPAQAIIGGISVRTHLNPWVVSLHLISSMVIIGLAVVYIVRIDRPLPRPSALRWGQLIAAFAVLYLGTVVTGAGPHAGDAGRNATKYRNGFSPLETAQLHTDFVFLLVGLTLALLITRRSRAVIALFAAELVNAVIGFVQYFTHLPVVLVGFHMLGAALVAATATWVLLDDAASEVDERRQRDADHQQ
jgi:cytochrome c oxidase assembly protein subunit 15